MKAHTRRWTAPWLALWIALGAALAPAQDLAELEVDHALTLDYPTPHTDWATPYAKGTTRVLCFSNGRGTVPRHFVELMQRFDIEAKAVFWARIVDSRKEHWHGGETGKLRMLELLKEDWDAYIILDLPLDRMSAEAQVRLLTPVIEKGKGLVFIGKGNKRILKKERALPTPAFLRDVPARGLYAVGKGRGAHMPSIPNITYGRGWEQAYDHYAEQLGRAVLWSASKDTSDTVNVQLSPNDTPNVEEIRANGAPQVVVTASVANAAAKLSVRLRIRRAGGPEHVIDGGKLAANGRFETELPLLPAGKYHLDAWLLDGKGQVVTWSTRSVEVTSERVFKALELQSTWSEVGGSLGGTVQLAGGPAPGRLVRVRLLDPERRELVRQEFTDTEDVYAFDFPVQKWLPMLVTVEAQLIEDGDEICRSEAQFFHVVKRHRDRWNFLIWDTPGGTLGPYAEKSLADHGVSLQLQGGTPRPYVAANNISWVPYTTRIMSKHTEDMIMKPFCWNDEEAVQKHVTSLARRYESSRQHGVFVWSLGDEVDTKGACLSPHCAHAYRTYLRTEYGGVLAALNDSWGTSFTDWSQAGLADPKDNEEVGSLKAKNYSRWFDRQAFKSHNFVQFCRKYRAAYEAIDPQAKVGFEGAGRFDRGDDIDLIVRNNTFWSPYPGTADEVIRSIAPREFPRANWMGYTKDADSLLAKYWRMVTLGMDSVWWWRWDCIGRFHGWLAPDLRPFPAVKDILADTAIVWDGLGDLLLKSQMHDDGVAMLYSYPSSLSQHLEHGGTYGGYESAHKAAHSLVREMRLQFRYVTDRTLRDGEWDASRTRVLILPRVEALSDKTAVAIRTFVENGGLVVADTRTGVFNEHLKLRKTGALDDLFGISRTAPVEAVAVVDPAFGKLRIDPSVSLADGNALQVIDGVPIMVTKKTGKGTTLYLNFDFSVSPNLANPEISEEHAERMAKLFADHGVEPVVRLLSDTDDGQGRTRSCTITRWQNGEIQFVSLFRVAGKEGKASVRLPKRMAVYDLRARKYLGKKTTFDTTILPNRATFLALMPAKAHGGRLALSQSRVEQGGILTATLSVPKAYGLHAFRIRVRGKDGEITAHRRRLVIGRTAVSFPVPTAFNDPVGKVRVEATDLYSGKTLSETFRITATETR